jgi:hypothetical protein
MKYSVFFMFLLLISISCSEGDTDIAGFEFEETVNVCKSDVFTLYRLGNNGHREVLIVTLTDKEIKQTEEPVLPVNVSTTGHYSVTDRVFDEEVTGSYFCSVIPPAKPKVTKDWRGVSGKIYVKNEAVYNAEQTEIIAYRHIIVLNDVVLESGDETLIFSDTYLFGTFETTYVPEVGP